THQIKKTIFGWVILLYPKLPSEFVFKFGGIFLCPFFGQLSICSYEPRHHCDFPILGEPVVAGLFVVSWMDLTNGGSSAVG
ncbi:MAG: hypothetical protein E6132_07220, partial [Actinomyces sp.]|nr:hypothetical protein [Actinomycetaceae bacterium]MDU5379818.1 hypothetical protein [Actinomyces sp.]